MNRRILEMNTEKPKFDIIYGIDNVLNIQLELISDARHRLDICMDEIQPRLIVESRQFRQRFLDNKTKGIKLRYLTKITNDNLYCCKDLLSMTDELRHLDDIRGNFYVSEKEYAASASLHKRGKSAEDTMMIYSTTQEIIQHQQHIFETMWNASASAERKIWEIEQNIDLGTTEIIDNPKTKALFIDLIKSAKFEILLICPTVNAFLREHRIGALQLFREITTDADSSPDHNASESEIEESGKRKRNRVNIKILTPTNELVSKIIEEMGIEWAITTVSELDVGKGKGKSSGPSSCSALSSKNESDNTTQPLQIRHLESRPMYNVTTVTILIVDRKFSFAIEKVDDAKEEFIEAVGLSTYSTSTPTVVSYVSIFENFWNQLELYEKLSANEKMEREFINLAAHELRTPAQTILGYTELALMEEDEGYENTVDSEKPRYIAAAHRNALRLQRRTKDILYVARIESNTLRLNKERFDIVEKIEDVIIDIIHAQNVNPKTTNNTNTNIVFDKSDASLFIFADKVRIYEVVTNLLNNAISTTKKNNGKIIISTKVVKSGKDDVHTNDNSNNDNTNITLIIMIIKCALSLV